MRYFAIILLALLSLVGAPAQEKSQKSISLLTCEPSDNQIYTAWGHTALRVTDPETGLDLAFNYGIFSFDDLGLFIYRFVKGETDYKLGISLFDRSIREAAHKKAHLYEQKLNLTEEETTRICEALFENAKPENCYYRYNFFFDNCATRPRAIIEKCLDGGISYPASTNTRTYREIIHELLSEMKWYTLGIDLCLGSPTDKVVEGKDVLFLPVEMMQCFAQATKANGEPLVKETETLYAPLEMQTEGDWTSLFSPTLVCWTLLLLIIAHTLFYTNINKSDRWFDALFFGAAGLVGTLIFFLAFISEHPCTNPNYNLLWLNPLQLIFAASQLTSKGETLKKQFHYLQLGCIGLILLGGWFWMPQEFNPSTLPLMISLALRSIHWIRPDLFKVKQLQKMRRG